MKDLFSRKLQVINIGLDSFTAALERSGTPFVNVDWRPPIEVHPSLSDIVEANKSKIDAANRTICKTILAGQPTLKEIGPALDVIPGMRENLILHAGPPVAWPDMCGPMRGAIIGALKYEGAAKDDAEAGALAASGDIAYAPCHDYAAVGPMAGIISASMPVFVVENTTYGNRAFCTVNEGLGKVLRYGAYGPGVIDKLKWMERVLYPALAAALAALGEIDLKHIMAQALHMGDELHNRNRAATSLFYRRLAPALVKDGKRGRHVEEVLTFIDGNDHFFLNLSMAAAKATLDAARNVEYGSIVVAMSRNGRHFGVQLAGTGAQWFTGPAPLPDGLFFPGFSKADANPDIGDSAVTETVGLGGFAIAAAPAIVQFVGGTVADALAYTRQMYKITAVENNVFQIPYLDFRGTPTAIDARKVVENNILPFIDTGIAHKDPGVGQVGAGVVRAPSEPFKNAYIGLAQKLREDSRGS